MSEHPLGDLDGTTMTDAPSPVADLVKEPSIVDQILDLDRLLSADVRRAEKTARFATRPDLEADIDDLHAELATMVDERGNPLDDDGSLAAGRTAQQVALELRAKQRELAESFRSVRVRALPEDEWEAFYQKHRKGIEAGQRPPEMWAELIVACAIRPTFTPEKLQKFRTKVGHPAVDEIALACWAVNTTSGVSIPKSQLSSAVLKRMRL